MLWFCSNPSISLSSWFNVASLSSDPDMIPSCALFLPMESISSMNTMQGAFFFASLNKSRTRAAPRPPNTSMKEDPEVDKNATPASPATALAINVLPVPGGPSMITPLGTFAPILVNCSGVLRKVTISCSSSLASSCPATCVKFTPVWGTRSSLPVNLPISWKGLSPIWPTCRLRRKKKPPMTTHGAMFNSKLVMTFTLIGGGASTEYSTLWVRRDLYSSGVWKEPCKESLLPSLSSATRLVPVEENVTSLILSFSTRSRNWV
mmetsp:Transcript_6309/g.12495  ORF Transcript_6309/g.12495 Transcript_6309/m.12495 type:complete len:263 (+) Transcript_6309:2202-2990(+)